MVKQSALQLSVIGHCINHGPSNSQAEIPGNWKDLVQEATTEVLKLGPSPMALLFQALLQYITKMPAR